MNILKSILVVSMQLSSVSNAEQICVNSASDACLTDPFPPISSSKPVDVFDRTTEIATQCFYDHDHMIAHASRKEFILANRGASL